LGEAVEDDFYINLADCVFGPEELEFLLEEWLKDAQPKTINELARMYLAQQIESEKGYLPYDRRRCYKENDKIVVRLQDHPQPQLAEVISVSNNYGRDTDGFTYDAIELHLLGQAARLVNENNRTFIANYKGEKLAGLGVRSFEIIKEKDEAEVIPKILIAISKDKRLVAFEEEWLPTQLLADVSDKLSGIEEIIAECKQALSTGDILEKVRTGDNKEELNHCLEFSLNYFLKKDKRFIRISGPITKWNLRQITKPDQSNINEKREWTVTIKAEWLEKDILLVPRKLATYMHGTNTIHILYDQIDEVLPYEENDRLIEGLSNFYSKKAIAEFDQVHIYLQALEPTRLFVYSSWKPSLDELLRIKPPDLDWEQSSLRNCIIVVLAKFRTPAHYREIYTEIAIHKHISWGAILGTLSRYSPSLFIHVGWGKWGLAGWAEQEGRPKSEAAISQEAITASNEIWKAVESIEENDYVYKLLKRIKKPLSFDEVCSRLADYLKVDVHELRATGFLKADDERFRRLDDGTWALEEWFSRDDDTEVTKPCSGKTSKSGLFWLLLTIILILLLIGTASALIWLFIYGR